MVLAYALIGGFVGMVSSVFAYFALDVSVLMALAVYSAVGAGTMALTAFAFAFRPTPTAERQRDAKADWRGNEAA